MQFGVPLPHNVSTGSTNRFKRKFFSIQFYFHSRMLPSVPNENHENVCLQKRDFAKMVTSHVMVAEQGSVWRGPVWVYPLQTATLLDVHDGQMINSSLENYIPIPIIWEHPNTFLYERMGMFWASWFFLPFTECSPFNSKSWWTWANPSTLLLMVLLDCKDTQCKYWAVLWQGIFLRQAEDA